MIPSKLILRGFIPLALNQISEVTYTPERLIQLLVGDNGSGKTSLLRAWTVMPMDKRMFEKNGYREVHFQTDKGLYVLKSDYGHKVPVHEFWLDDINLNPGGTQSIQAQLAESELGYSKFVHLVLCGKLNICDMTPMQLKDLLLNISGLDFKFALDVHDNFKRQWSDANSVLKHISHKYQDVSSRFNALGEADAWTSQSKELQEQLTLLIPKTNFAESPTGDYEHKLQKQWQSMEALVGRLVEGHKRLDNALIKANLNLSSFENVGGLYATEQIHAQNKETAQTEITELKGKLASYDDTRKRIADLPEAINLENVNAKVFELESNIARKEKRLAEYPYDYSHLDPKPLLETMNKAYQLAGYYVEVSTPNQKCFGIQESQELLARHEQTTRETAETESKLEALDHRIQHMRVALDGTVECPSCQTKIYASVQVSEEKFAALEAERKTLGERLDVLTANLIPLNESMAELKEYERMMAQLKNIIVSHPETRDVFRSCGTIQDVIKTPSIALTAFSKALHYASLLDGTADAKAELKEQLFFQQTLETTDINGISDSLEKMETMLSDLYARVGEMDAEMQKVRRIRGIVNDEILLPMESLEEAIVDINDTIESFYKAGFTNCINSEVRLMQNQLAAIQKQLVEYDGLKARIEELETDETELTLKKKTLEVLLKAISPKTGIIADQLSIVTTTFIQNVNMVVESIWEKAIELEDPTLRTKNMDFKFNVVISGARGPELSDLSSGQKDVFNLAACIVIKAQLSLDNYPMYLDEVGATFDEAHRDNLLDFIKMLPITGSISKLFLISHYSHQHGGFNNADLVSLKWDNITIPNDRLLNESLLIA